MGRAKYKHLTAARISSRMQCAVHICEILVQLQKKNNLNRTSLL